MRLLRRVRSALQSEISNREYLRTTEVGGPPLLKAERILSRLMCAVHRAHGLLNWSWSVSPSPGIPPSEITKGGRQVILPKALEQPPLLPRDMEAYRRFSQQELFLSLKKDLAMVSSLIYYPT